jgi:hypothetical protein
MANKFKQFPFSQEILLTFIWDREGPILKHYKEKEQTVHSTTYLAAHRDKLIFATVTKE